MYVYTWIVICLVAKYTKTSLAKVSDWNSFRTNPKISESFRNLYSHQTVSFRSNPKLVFNPNQSEAHSKSIRTCTPDEFDWIRSIRINPYFWIRILNGPRIDSNWRLTSDWIGMKLFSADTNSGMIRKVSDWFGMNFNPKLSPGYFVSVNCKYTRKWPGTGLQT